MTVLLCAHDGHLLHGCKWYMYSACKRGHRAVVMHTCIQSGIQYIWHAGLMWGVQWPCCGGDDSTRSRMTKVWGPHQLCATRDASDSFHPPISLSS